MSFKRIFAAFLIAVMMVPAQLSAQSGVQFPPGSAFGNATASPRPGKAETLSALLDRALGSTPGGVAFRGTTLWLNTTAPIRPGDLDGRINLVKRQVFLGPVTTTYFPVTGMAYSLLECVGSGGGGGGAAGTASNVYAGGGGGEGEYSWHMGTPADIGTSLPIIIPAGGAGGVGASNGSDGAGSTTMASLVSASPGRGGKFASSAATTGVFGGLGGTGGTSDMSSPGMPGGPGFLNAANASILMPSGNGGGGHFGGGGVGVSSGASAVNGNPGGGYGSGGSGGSAVNTASTATGGAGKAGACITTDYAAQNLVPSAAQPIVIQRTATNSYNVNAPIVNGAPGEYVTWQFINIGSPQLLELWGVSTNENGIIRTQTDGSVAQSVFEFAMNIGRTDNAFGTYQLAGNFHGNTTGGSPSISMDGGPNLLTMPIGNYVRGTSLTIAQTPSLTLPSIATPNGTPGSTFSNINQGHIITATGITFSMTTTNVQTNAGDQNSYFGMMPTTGMDRVQFGANTPFAINTGIANQSPPQGQVSTITTWNTARPDLKLVLQLPNGSPCSPDGWTKVTTSNTFNSDFVAPNFAKIYTNSRSGGAGIAATNSSCLSRYIVTK